MGERVQQEIVFQKEWKLNNNTMLIIKERKIKLNFFRYAMQIIKLEKEMLTND